MATRYIGKLITVFAHKCVVILGSNQQHVKKSKGSYYQTFHKGSPAHSIHLFKQIETHMRRCKFSIYLMNGQFIIKSQLEQLSYINFFKYFSRSKRCQIYLSG